MLAPPEPQQQSPPMAVSQQPYKTHSDSGHGSIGLTIGVVAVIAFLGFVAGMIGRLCSGRGIMGYGQFDFEGSFERKFSSCIDGGINPPAPPPTNISASAADSVPVAIPIEISEGTKQTPWNPPAAAKDS